MVRIRVVISLLSQLMRSLSGGPPPKTLTKEWEEKSNELALEDKSNPITGNDLSTVDRSILTSLCFFRYLFRRVQGQGLHRLQVIYSISFSTTPAIFWTLSRSSIDDFVDLYSNSSRNPTQPALRGLPKPPEASEFRPCAYQSLSGLSFELQSALTGRYNLYTTLDVNPSETQLFWCRCGNRQFHNRPR